MTNVLRVTMKVFTAARGTGKGCRDQARHCHWLVLESRCPKGNSLRHRLGGKTPVGRNSMGQAGGAGKGCSEVTLTIG